MHTSTDALQSSSTRRLAVRRRGDLEARRQRYQGRVSWVVKEPLGLNYFRFKEEEYFILRQLDGRASLEEIRERFEAEFPPQKISLEGLQQFIGSLHRSGLVVSDAPGQGEQLCQRHERRLRQERLGRWTNVLCIRFRGIDPEGILEALYPWARLMFSPPAMLLCCLLALAALLLVTVQFDIFLSRLPTFHQFFSPANFFWLFVALAFTKVLHEFGHGLTCRHFGGECHEMGVLFLVLTPCLYCNVSDSWMLPNKWHRAAIGAAGMYVELVLASIATFLWWFSEPGLLNNLCLSVMFVCSVSTLIFNANPLLRYDGYYILADLVEIPNLRQKASRILTRKLGWWCLGIPPSPDPFLPKQNQAFFALYAVAAAVYRWVIVLSILWFLDQVFKPYRLQVIGQLIAIAALYGLVVVPVVKLVKFFWIPGRIEKVQKVRMFATAALVAGMVAAVAMIPVPHRVLCPLEVRAYNATPVYVEVGGVMQEPLVRPGQHVRAQQPLVRLTSYAVDDSVAELQGDYHAADARVKSLEEQLHEDLRIGGQIPPAKQARDAAARMLRQGKRDQQRLWLVASRSGTIMPPPSAGGQPETEGRLPGWSGTPFHPGNVGCSLRTGDMFCLIGDPRKMEAVLVVDQADVEFVQVGDEVEIKLDELPAETFRGVIEEVSRSDLKRSPRNLSNKSGGDLATKTEAGGVERPLSTSFQARVRLKNPDGLLRIGLRGQAKIHAGQRTLGERFYRYLCQTFRFKR